MLSLLIVNTFTFFLYVTQGMTEATIMVPLFYGIYYLMFRVGESKLFNLNNVEISTNVAIAFLSLALAQACAVGQGYQPDIFSFDSFYWIYAQTQVMLIATNWIDGIIQDGKELREARQKADQN